MVKNLPASVGDSGSVPGLDDSLEQEMATRSSILAGKIPWTEEPGHRQRSPNGHKRVRHDLAAK